MRTLVMGLAALMLFAGCLDAGNAKRQDDSAGDGVAPPTGLTAIQGEGEATAAPLPPEFALGFKVTSYGTGLDGPEPNIGVTPSGAVFATALETVVRSLDSGVTWEAVYTQKVGGTSDPMLWVDTDTGRIFSPQMFPLLVCSSFITSDDDGASWTEIPGTSCGLPVLDHQKVASGPYPEGSAIPFNPVYPNLVTYCYNKLTATHCAVSNNGGLRFEYDTIIDTSPFASTIDTQFSCGGLNGHQHHALDGTIYVPYGFNCGQGFVAVSKDGGVSYTRHRLEVPQLALDPEVTSTPDGTAFYLYKATDGRVFVLRSSDDFATFDGPFLVSPPEVGTSAFMGMTAGSNGRLVIAYLGTNETVNGGIEDDVSDDAEWNLYVTMSVDAGAPAPTFVTVQGNAEGDPVQRGSICQHRGCAEDSPNGPDNRNLLDFIDLHAGPDGRFYVAYADGCTSDACRGPDGKPSDSRDSELTVARIEVGPSLLSDKPAFALT